MTDLIQTVAIIAGEKRALILSPAPAIGGLEQVFEILDTELVDGWEDWQIVQWFSRQSIEQPWETRQ